MVRTIISVLILTACVAAQSTDRDRAVRFSELPIEVQNRVLGGVHRDTPWTQLGELSASDGTTSDSFGISGAVDGDIVVVGATGAQVGSNANQGAAYVFVKPKSGWQNMTQVAILTASDGKVGGYVRVRCDVESLR